MRRALLTLALVLAAPAGADVPPSEPVERLAPRPEAQLATVVKQRDAEIQACYRAELEAHPGAAGAVELDLTLRPDGAVEAAETYLEGQLSQQLADCIAGAADHWRLPSAKDRRRSYAKHRIALTPPPGSPPPPPRVDPPLTTEEVDRVLQAPASSAALLNCSEAERVASQGRGGTVSVAFTIEETGAVSQVQATPVGASAAAASCVAAAAKAWSFRPRKGAAPVKVTHAFEVGRKYAPPEPKY